MLGPSAIGIGIVAVLFGLLARRLVKMNIRTGRPKSQ